MTSLNTAPHKRSIGYLLGMTILMFGAYAVWVPYNSILLLPLVEKVVLPRYSSLAVGQA